MIIASLSLLIIAPWSSQLILNLINFDCRPIIIQLTLYVSNLETTATNLWMYFVKQIVAFTYAELKLKILV
jgi:hypothetical protein